MSSTNLRSTLIFLYIPGYECNSPVAPSDFERRMSGYRLTQTPLLWNPCFTSAVYSRHVPPLGSWYACCARAHAPCCCATAGPLLPGGVVRPPSPTHQAGDRWRYLRASRRCLLREQTEHPAVIPPRLLMVCSTLEHIIILMDFVIAYHLNILC